MTDDERRELIAAVREALGPFKEELKTEIRTELLEPMEARLRGEMGEMETRLRGEMGDLRGEMGDLRGEMGEMETRLRGEMGEMETRLRGEMGEMETRLRGEMGEMETRLRGEMGEMETRLRGEMGEMETRLRGEMGEMETRLGTRLERLETEVQSITNDIIGPFIEMAEARHSELVERLERLETQVKHNRDKINQVLTQVDMQERRLMRISDDVIIIRQRLNSLERRLGGEITYDITEAELVLAEERSLYEMIRELEERVARLEGESK